jgi:hypothetical protein
VLSIHAIPGKSKQIASKKKRIAMIYGMRNGDVPRPQGGASWQRKDLKERLTGSAPGYGPFGVVRKKKDSLHQDILA